MKTLIRLPAFFVLFILILSITVSGRHLFSYIYDVISPATTYAQAKTMSFFGSSMASTQVYAKKLFDNSVPSVKRAVDDQVAIGKKKVGDLEEITVEDKKALNSLIKSH